MTRARALARCAVLVTSVVSIISAPGCGPKSGPVTASPPPIALHLEPASDLAPAAGLEWLVDARPRALAAIPDLIPVIALVVPEARFAMFAAAHGGLDVRQMQELCIAKYRDSLLSLARIPFDPQRLERAFTERVTNAPGRGVDVPNPPVVRLWGEVNGEPQQLVVFGRELVALEQGRAGPIRVAEAFAQNKLKRAVPALRGAALSRAAQVLGDAPVRVFAPGPFEGESGQGLGGLVRASTAVGASADFAGAPARIALRIVLTGAWGKDAPAAAERLAAATHVVAESPFGRLLGLDHPVEPPTVRTMEDALVFSVTVDGAAVARGLHDALDAEIGEIMRR